MADLIKVQLDLDKSKADQKLKDFKKDVSTKETVKIDADASSASASVKNLNRETGSLITSAKSAISALSFVAVVAGAKELASKIYAVGEAMADLQNRSAQLNTTTTNLQKIYENFLNRGIKEEKTTKALSQISILLGELERGTDRGIDAFARLGISADDILGKDVVDQLNLISSRLNSIGDNASTKKSLQDIFGAELTTEVAPALKNFTTDMENLHTTIVDEKNVQIWKDMKIEIDKLGKSSFNTLINDLSSVVELVTKVSKTANSAIQNQGFARKYISGIFGDSGGFEKYYSNTYGTNVELKSGKGKKSDYSTGGGDITPAVVQTSAEIKLTKELADVKNAAYLDSLNLAEKEIVIRNTILTLNKEISDLQAKSSLSEDERVKLLKDKIALVKEESNLISNQKSQADARAESDKNVADALQKAFDEKVRQENEAKKLRDDELKSLSSFIESYDTASNRIKEQKKNIDLLNQAEREGLVTAKEKAEILQKINEKYQTYAQYSIADLSRMKYDKNLTEMQRKSAGEELDVRFASDTSGASWGTAFSVGAKDATESWGSTASQMVEIGRQTTENLSDGFTTFFMDLQSGTMSAGEAFVKFGETVLVQMEQMLLKALIVQPIVAGITGALGVATPTAEAATAAPVSHTGGVVGQVGTIRRFHNGGVVGDEVGVIAKRGEKIIAQQDQNSTESQKPNIQILNNFDYSQVGRYIAENPDVIINVIGSNRTKVKGILG